MAEKSLKDLTSAVYKIAENSPKIQKDVKDIRDVICGTDGLIDSLLLINQSINNIGKKGSIASIKTQPRIDSKSLERTRKKLVKNTDEITFILGKILKQMRTGKNVSGNGGGIGKLDLKTSKPDKNDRLLKSIEIIERLRGIKLKDFLFAKQKIAHIGKIMGQSLKIFRKFKNNKEVTSTINFINASVDLVKELAKISRLSKTSQKGVKAIERIFLGGKGSDGLLKVFRKLEKNKKSIVAGKALTKRIEQACGSMLLTSILLTGIAVISPVAFLGALAMKGIVFLLIGTFKLLNKSKASIIKGAMVLTVLGVSVITFSLGLGLMAKAVRNLKLKDVGLMVASIAGVGLTVAGIGLLAVPIAIGSATMLLLGASLGIFALSVMAWQKLDAKKSMGNIKVAVEGLREVFGLELGKGDNTKSFGQRLGGGILDIAMSVLNFGKTFFVMGTILLANAALGMLYLGLKPWENYNGAKKAASNIKTAIGALKEVFGLTGSEGESPAAKAKGGLNDLIGLASSIFRMGKTFVQMGTLVFATAMMDIIKKSIIAWDEYNPTNAVSHMKTALNGLKECFGLDKGGDSIKGFDSNKVTLLDLGASLLKMGDAFIQMGTLLIATGAMEKIKENLNVWDNYNATNSLKNIKTAIHGLTEVFGLHQEVEEVPQKSGWNKVRGFFSKAVDVIATPVRMIGDMASAAEGLAESGKTFSKLSALLSGSVSMLSIKSTIEPWDSYTGETAIRNMSATMESLTNILTDGSRMLESSKIFRKMSKNFYNGMDILRRSFIGTQDLSTLVRVLGNSKISDPINSSVNAINRLDITKATIIRDIFKEFTKINRTKPFDKFSKSVDKFVDACNDMVDSIEKLGDIGNNESPEVNTVNNTVNGQSTGNTNTVPQTVNGGVSVNNTKQLADAIANALRSLNVRLDTSSLDINLVVDGYTGKSVKLVLQD